MLVTTAKPLTIAEMMSLSETKDALIDLNGWKCRYLALSPGQTIEVPYTYYDNDTKLAFGLRHVSKPNSRYEFIAFRIY